MDDGLIAYETVSDPPGIEIIDRVEQLRYQLFTPEPVSPAPVDSDTFRFPVGQAVRIDTEAISVPSDVSIVVRDGDGEMLSQVEHLDSESFGPGSYIIDLSTQVKTYLEVTGSLEIASGFLETRFSFAEPTAVDIGFRSRHSRPAGTITTTAAPADVMETISTFGSALKTTSPELSFPTHRGHPPRVQLGEELDIPDTLDRPDTGIHVEVPSALETIYPVSTLAYYLGATVGPGHRPRLVTDAGFEYEFDYPQGYERDVAQTLKQVFLLDCVTRTEGLYRIALHERNALEWYVDIDWAALYEQSIAERLESYLSIPYRVVSEYVPEWRLTAHVEPVAETVEQLPFVVDDLAVVRTAETAQSAASAMNGDVGSDVLTRSASRTDGGVTTRSTAGMSKDVTFVEPTATDSLEQAWIGEDIPIGASKLTIEAFHNRLDREVGTGDISITIVVNDSRMDEERDLVNRAYGDREDLPFEVSVRRDLTTAELRETLTEDRDFLHYIGHIDEEGFECADGRLDATTLETTGVDAFLLNACNSYRQGLDLVSAGAIGGIVTLTEIINDRAIHIGETIARLLNTGFPLRAALTVAREEHILGGQYIVVGDGGMTVTQAKSRTPIMVELADDCDSPTVEIRAFATDTAGLGTIYTPYIDDIDEYFLSSGRLGPFDVAKDELRSFLELDNIPVKTSDNTIKWCLED